MKVKRTMSYLFRNTLERVTRTRALVHASLGGVRFAAEKWFRTHLRVRLVNRTKFRNTLILGASTITAVANLLVGLARWTVDHGALEWTRTFCNAFIDGTFAWTLVCFLHHVARETAEEWHGATVQVDSARGIRDAFIGRTFARTIIGFLLLKPGSTTKKRHDATGQVDGARGIRNAFIGRTFARTVIGFLRLKPGRTAEKRHDTTGQVDGARSNGNALVGRASAFRCLVYGELFVIGTRRSSRAVVTIVWRDYIVGFGASAKAAL
jgi:hypothetical protein